MPGDLGMPESDNYVSLQADSCRFHMHSEANSVTSNLQCQQGALSMQGQRGEVQASIGLRQGTCLPAGRPVELPQRPAALPCQAYGSRSAASAHSLHLSAPLGLCAGS